MSKGSERMTQNTGRSHERRDGSTAPADVRVPSQSRSSEDSGPIPRPFALGSVTDDRLIPAPRTPESLDAPGRGGVLAPPRPVAPAPTPARGGGRRSGVLIAVSVAVIVLLLAGLYAAAVSRERSPDADQAAPVAALTDVTYRVTTTGGARVVVSYSRTTAGEYATGSASGVPSPWSVDTRVSDYYGASLTASVVPSGPDAAPVTDTLTCAIVQNGRVIVTQTATGPDATVSCLR